MQGYNVAGVGQKLCPVRISVVCYINFEPLEKFTFILYVIVSLVYVGKQYMPLAHYN